MKAEQVSHVRPEEMGAHPHRPPARGHPCTDSEDPVTAPLDEGQNNGRSGQRQAGHTGQSGRWWAGPGVLSLEELIYSLSSRIRAKVTQREGGVRTRTQVCVSPEPVSIVLTTLGICLAWRGKRQLEQWKLVWAWEEPVGHSHQNNREQTPARTARQLAHPSSAPILHGFRKVRPRLLRRSIPATNNPNLLSLQVGLSVPDSGKLGPSSARSWLRGSRCITHPLWAAVAFVSGRSPYSQACDSVTQGGRPSTSHPKLCCGLMGTVG